MGILSSIGDWMEEKYNNLTTAVSITTTPSTYITGTGGYTTPTVNSNGISSDITASVGSSSTSSSTASSIYQTAEDKFEAEVEEIYALDEDKDTSNDSSSSTTQTPSSYITGSNLTASDTGYNGISTEVQTSSDYDAIAWVQTVIENIQKALNTMQYTDYEDNALENDGVLGDKTISAWNEFIEDKGVTNYLGSVYNYVNPSTSATNNLYGALDYSSNYADNLDFTTNQNYTGEVSSYLEDQGYINPSSVETNASQGSSIESSYPAYAYSSINDITANMQISASGSEILEMASDSLSIIGGLYEAMGGSKSVSAIGSALSIAVGVEYAKNGYDREALVTVGGAAVGTMAAMLATSLVIGGTATVAIPVIAGVAGTLIGKELVGAIYDNYHNQ